MPHFYADIHCHTTTKPFNTQKGPENDKLNPFESFPNKINSALLNDLRKNIENIAQIRLSSQSNFDTLYASGHRIVVISITPPEVGFFIMNQKDDSFGENTIKRFAAVQDPPFSGAILTPVVNAITGFANENIEFCKKKVKSYYTDLLKPEYEFVKGFDGEKRAAGYTMRIVNSFAEIEAAHAQDPDTLCVIISVEGAHSLFKAPLFFEVMTNQITLHANDKDNLTGLQEYENNINDMKQWKHPPFFITFFHHEWNGLGGHARSLTIFLTKLVNQEEGINLGINALGREVIRRLLSKKNGKRILIDIKHMSPKSRRDYYEILTDNEITGGDNIPIICSHCGLVTKRKTLAEMIELADNTDIKEEDTSDNYLHECSINLCTEDVMNIFKSKGLIGIQLDEKRIAGKEIIKIIQEKEGVLQEEINRQYASVVLANLLRAVQIVNDPQAWNMLCIGSDFDGLINHLDCCPSSAEIPMLEGFMLDVLNSGTDIKQAGFNYSISAAEIRGLLFGLTPEEAMEKVFFTNVKEFLKVNFV